MRALEFLECVFIFATVARSRHDDEIMEQLEIRSEVGSDVGSEVRSEVRPEVGLEVGLEVGSELRPKVQN